jgi:hypothetical protein
MYPWGKMSPFQVPAVKEEVLPNLDIMLKNACPGYESNSTSSPQKVSFMTAVQVIGIKTSAQRPNRINIVKRKHFAT